MPDWTFMKLSGYIILFNSMYFHHSVHKVKVGNQIFHPVYIEISFVRYVSIYLPHLHKFDTHTFESRTTWSIMLTLSVSYAMGYFNNIYIHTYRVACGKFKYGGWFSLCNNAPYVVLSNIRQTCIINADSKIKLKTTEFALRRIPTGTEKCMKCSYI